MSDERMLSLEDISMFEKWESRSYPKADAKVIHAHAFKWWQAQGFQVRETGPGQFIATSASRWGLQREASVNVRDLGQTTLAELKMRAHITDEAVIAGGLALVFLWPVAVVGGALSYAKYEEDAINLMRTFWGTLEGTVSIHPVETKEQVIHTTAVTATEVPGAQMPTGTPLSRDQKLSMLEDRLARSEINEATYKEIKSRLEGG